MKIKRTSSDVQIELTHDEARLTVRALTEFVFAFRDVVDLQPEIEAMSDMLRGIVVAEIEDGHTHDS